MHSSRIEENFDPVFTTQLSLREKQIQQNYRPIIGIHKWFARRPGTLFRSLLLAEFNGKEPLETNYWTSHNFQGVIADPFMGGGTPIFEANRLGFSVIGCDINPMATWIVRQSLAPLQLGRFLTFARAVIRDTEAIIGDLYKTDCTHCKNKADVKYFLWVKTQECPHCRAVNDLFPRYLLAEAERHPLNVLVCSRCGELNEYRQIPTRAKPQDCRHCQTPVFIEGPVKRQNVQCKECGSEFRFGQSVTPVAPPKHRLWALEYHCRRCKPKHAGRFFKRADYQDLENFAKARDLLAASEPLPIPNDGIPNGDETARLHRWGYQHYREMFNERQLLGLGTLMKRILKVPEAESRHALLTVFSDFLRYQNMLCRYDTYALKCQDIFSIHGFPVSLVQCENSLLGIPSIGSGAYRHFIEKYVRAKRYCAAPFETKFDLARRRKILVPIRGESIAAEFSTEEPTPERRQAWIVTSSATMARLRPASLDGVFTDPPYFNNVQYAELMDFCFSWLRLGLQSEFSEFECTSTRSYDELTGNFTTGKGLEHFTAGLSSVFSHYAAALKPNGPFVFTYHHNDWNAYTPLVVAILDAGLDCVATLPAAAEMSASIHIMDTGSSILDSVFVCRNTTAPRKNKTIEMDLLLDVKAMARAGVRVSEGDVRCLAAGHVARRAVNRLRKTWQKDLPLSQRIERASNCLRSINSVVQVHSIAQQVRKNAPVNAKETAVAASI